MEVKEEVEWIQPHKRVSSFCIGCGEPISPKQKDVRPEGNRCRSCSNKHRNADPLFKEQRREQMRRLNKINPMNPKWVAANKKVVADMKANPEYKKKWRAGIKKRSQNPAWKEKLSEYANNRSHAHKEKLNEAHRVNGKDPEIQKKIAITKQGITPEEYCGKTGQHRAEYSEKFTPEIREKCRAFWNYNCARCEKPQSENLIGLGKNPKLGVHHVFGEKKACSETDIVQMEIARRRFPKGVARFGEPEYSKEELFYIRMMIPVCHKCHALQQKEVNLPYEETTDRKHFVELILLKGGRWR